MFVLNLFSLSYPVMLKFYVRPAVFPYTPFTKNCQQELTFQKDLTNPYCNINCKGCAPGTKKYLLAVLVRQRAVTKVKWGRISILSTFSANIPSVCYINLLPSNSSLPPLLVCNMSITFSANFFLPFFYLQGLWSNVCSCGSAYSFFFAIFLLIL